MKHKVYCYQCKHYNLVKDSCIDGMDMTFWACTANRKGWFGYGMYGHHERAEYKNRNHNCKDFEDCPTLLQTISNIWAILRHIVRVRK